MREIKLADAKARLSAVLDDAIKGEPAIITRHGKPEGVILSFVDWQKLSKIKSFGEMLASSPFEPGDIPARDRRPIEPVDF